MADQRISALTELSSPADDDVVAGVDTSANATVKIPVSSLRSGLTTDADFDALVARVTALEGGSVGAHTRYFGMSVDTVIATADFAAANDSDTNEGAFPANMANAYPWFAVPESDGEPSGFFFTPNPVNQISGFTRQTGTVDDDNADPHIVFVSNAQVPPRNSERGARIQQ